MTFSSKQDFLDRVERHLDPPDRGFQLDLRPTLARPEPRTARSSPATLRPAAVLMGLVDRGDDFDVVLTQRPSTMRTHAGQVAFPGGKMDEADANLATAALREAHEEIGAPPQTTLLIGQAPPFETFTGFLISMFVGLYPADFTPKPCPREVEDVFTTPLSFLMNPDNHQEHSAEINGVRRRYYAMPHDGRFIWGVTAGMIRRLYEQLYRGRFEPVARGEFLPEGVAE